MEYAGNVTQKSNNRIMLPLHAYLAGGKLYGYSFAKSQFFPTTKESILIYYHGSSNIIWEGKPQLNDPN